MVKVSFHLPSGWTSAGRPSAFCAVIELWPHNEYFTIKDINKRRYLRKEVMLAVMVSGLTNNLWSGKFL
jgi:hypothetical protein